MSWGFGRGIGVGRGACEQANHPPRKGVKPMHRDGVALTNEPVNEPF